MAENVRGDLVVEPGKTAEYDRILPSGPILVLAVGVVLLVIGAVVSMGVAAEFGANYLVGAGVGIAGFLTCVAVSAKLANDSDTRRTALTRDLGALRSIVVFDEDAVGDDVLWVAAELAEQYERLDDEGAPLAAARVRTAAQDAELAERESTLHELATRILSLVEPATV